jgi:putative endonuclease
MFYVYVLKSEKDGRFYKGMTSFLEKRVKQHNLGQNKSTKGFLPWDLVYYEEFQTRGEARIREKYFKSGEGREFLKRKLNN